MTDNLYRVWMAADQVGLECYRSNRSRLLDLAQLTACIHLLRARGGQENLHLADRLDVYRDRLIEQHGAHVSHVLSSIGIWKEPMGLWYVNGFFVIDVQRKPPWESFQDLCSVERARHMLSLLPSDLLAVSEPELHLYYLYHFRMRTTDDGA